VPDGDVVGSVGRLAFAEVLKRCGIEALRLSDRRGFGDPRGDASTVIAGSAAELAEDSPIATGTELAASGNDCAWTDSINGSVGISTVIKVSPRNPFDTPQPHRTAKRRAPTPRIRNGRGQACNRGISISRIELFD
jgi:hypothetical protein